jgi:hypothetical protein
VNVTIELPVDASRWASPLLKVIVQKGGGEEPWKSVGRVYFQSKRPLVTNHRNPLGEPIKSLGLGRQKPLTVLVASATKEETGVHFGNGHAFATRKTGALVWPKLGV